MAGRSTVALVSKAEYWSSKVWSTARVVLEGVLEGLCPLAALAEQLKLGSLLTDVFLQQFRKGQERASKHYSSGVPNLSHRRAAF